MNMRVRIIPWSLAEVILPLSKEHLPLYSRFIDDDLAVWQHCNNKVLDAELIQNFNSKLPSTAAV